MSDKTLLVGDTYTIIENGEELKGTIVQVVEDGGFIVRWSDGVETVEDEDVIKLIMNYYGKGRGK